MHLIIRPLLVLLVSLAIFPAVPVQAQRGQFVEELFRTIAEAQLEREQRKRIEQEQREREQRERERLQPPIADVPTPIQPRRDRGEGPRGDHDHEHGEPVTAQLPAINVRSREAAGFAQDLVDFYATINSLVNDLRAASIQNPNLRPLLPDAYHVRADCRTLISNCDGLDSLATIEPVFSPLDACWRQLSFSLRAIGSLDGTCNELIRRADRLCLSMEKRFGVGPQFNRAELRDLMIVGSSYMETLIDDLELAAASRRQTAPLIHDIRLLKQQLLGQSGRLSQGNYDDVVAAFTDFAHQWGELSRRAYTVDDLHVHRRLDRIHEVGDQTYALLWLPPPTSTVDLQAAAQRLDRSFTSVMNRLTLATMVSLRSNDQRQLLEASRRLSDQCHQFENAAAQRSSLQELSGLFGGIDRDWSTLRGAYMQLGSLPRGAIFEVDQACGQIRGMLNIGPAVETGADLRSMLPSVAALEGGAEYLDADIQRFKRYFVSSSFRNSITDASRDVYSHAKRLNAELSQQLDRGRVDIADLQREAGKMVDAWQQLSRDIEQIQNQGLPHRSAEGVKRARRDLAPYVAEIAAALLQQ
ncbi:hypothetical protein CA13_13630 [Planctomycetes bacterium CA13]|uniref:Uncharacterized protein n=1 Tax=Novipirellula herctigrandis TaxID=2527986 RepID=A0A5C5YY22_9BACT|nr:hypothetical protein CA13_13630 [Planctomycetes bacterium CA13]